MKTKNTQTVRQLVPAALFLALAFVLPLLTGQVPKVGNMLCPMHFPVLLCGFVLGGPWGLAVGFAAPLLPFLAPARRAELAERYRALTPPRKMLPNQKKLWKALSGR